MFVEATTLISIANQLREWVGVLTAQDVREKSELKVALKSLYVAALETKSYLARRDKREPRNYEIEKRLMLLWSDAAVELRTIDLDLAVRCSIKGDYWSDPDPHTWTQEKIDESGIGIDDIYEAARNLLLDLD